MWIAVVLTAACGVERPVDAFELHRNLLLSERLEVELPGGPVDAVARRAAERLTGSGVIVAQVVPACRGARGNARTATRFE